MGKFDAIYFGEDENNIDGKRGRRNPAAAQSELILSKEQLYDMFQYILGIKRFEHQLLYQGCQVTYRLPPFSDYSLNHGLNCLNQ